MALIIGGAILAGGIMASEAAGSASDAQQAGISRGITETQRASAQGLEFLQPFADVGQMGIDQAGFLTDPQAQFDFLQGNPLFDLALQSANTGTMNLAASRGRVSAGDTLQQLSNNVLLSASPLIAEQKSSINDLLNLGSGTAFAQANTAIGAGTNVSNLLTQGGDVAAAGIIGQSNAQQQGISNALNAYIMSGGLTNQPTSVAPTPTTTMI